jgi:hypothetical protein
MRKHWLYLRYVLRHKWYVFLACRTLGVPPWQSIVHDASKFLPSEWLPYANYFYGPTGPPPGTFNYSDPSVSPNRAGNVDRWNRARVEAFDAAWNRHQKRNPHHWQFWLLVRDTGESVPLPMPDRYVREMVADWVGAGRAITGRVEVAGWYAKNRDRMRLAPETREAAGALIAKHYGEAVPVAGGI